MQELKIDISNVIDTEYRTLIERGLSNLGFHREAGFYRIEMDSTAEKWTDVQQLYTTTGTVKVKNKALDSEQFERFYKKIRPELKLEGLTWDKTNKVWFKQATLSDEKYDSLAARIYQMYSEQKLPSPDIEWVVMGIEPKAYEVPTDTPASTPEVPAPAPPADEPVKRWFICRRSDFKTLEVISTKRKTGFKLYKDRDEALKQAKPGRFLVEATVKPSGFVKVVTDKKKMMADWKKFERTWRKKLAKTGNFTKKGIDQEIAKLKKKFITGYKSPEAAEAVMMANTYEIDSIHKQCHWKNPEGKDTTTLVRVYHLIYTKVKGKYIFMKFFGRTFGSAYNAVPATKVSPPNYIKVPKLFVWDVLDLIASQEYGDETVNFIAGPLKKLKDRLDNYKDMKLELPKMNPARKLDDYQINGVKFLLSRGSALLAMSQGTGKTITGLVYIKKMYQMGKIQKAIVICPPMVRIEWLLEIHDWFGKGTLQRVGIVQGSPRDRQRIWNNKNTILYICNYELLSRRDAVWMKKLCQKYKVAIVCDESTKIKNTGKRRTSLMEIPARYRVAMSGTPFENHHIELYNLEQWLGTGLFGTKVDFISNYMSRRRRRQADNDSALHLMLVQKLMYRVLLQDVVDMKKLDIQERYVELPEEAKADYQKIVQIAEAKAGEWRATKEELDQLKLLITRDAETTKRIAVLEKKIKQIRGGMFAILNASRLYCAHPILLKLSNSGLANEVYDNLHAPKIAPKYDLLKKLMGEIAPDRSVIIFTGYVKMANKLYHKLKRMTDRRIFKLGGPTRMTVEDMLELKQNFAKHPGSVLISTDKGTYGLNLQSANVAIMYDQWWNPQRIGQRIARIYRRGQMKDCNSYLLMVKDEDVVEKAIHTVMGRKALFAGRVVDGWEPGSLGEALARR